MSDYEPVIDTLSEADPDTERRLGAFPNPSPAECPVVPLGYDGNLMIFGMPEGEIRREIAGRIGSLLKTDIFCCSAGQAFLANWRDKDDKFQRELAAVWFNRQCREAGKWDARRISRSLGVWPDGPVKIVLHKGDEVLRYSPDGMVETVPIIDALRVRSGPLYKLFPPGIAPTDPATSADGHWLLKQFGMWRFDVLAEDGLTGADVLAGWVMAAMLGAVAPFRGHLLIRAMAGSGKTTLMTLVHAAMSALSGELINSFSDAGFRSDIAGMARPIALDEVEGALDGGPSPVEQVMAYLRNMATGSGSNRKQGSQDGGTVTQTAVGSVIMAAILPPPLDSALGSRVADIRLLPLNGSDLSEEDRLARPRLATDPVIAEATRRAGELSPAFLGRALTGAWRYRQDVESMKAALIDANHDARTADLIAMLAAGRRLLLHDAPLTPREAADDVGFWAPLLKQRETVEVTSNPGADALAHLLTADSGLHRGDRRVTIGELVTSTVSGDKFYDDELKVLGLRIEKGVGKDAREGPWLLVANHHPGLDRIFAKTRWRDHRSALAYLDAMGPDYATWATKPLTYGLGIKQRGLAIPLTPWLENNLSRGSGAKASDGVPARVLETVPDEAYDF
ncbi:hypothetical protein [Brevundimonas subvibrioides]|uniref:Uncharacterized protein n=1 Tax=Brevundimonas subvibrioides (strain ATCC 15264 / DSM 4735 / LMG 14903 / NBRC 16000 / CB 81) TaxID=633149 RepID=D9QI98_BRESC|nr:hypothetical protein [Brevundimonas subvibrioides]ADK99400.1 hypothetical protein Bresu_0086 [Brevundimonas subvibrioides ATCC 15264]